MASIPSSRPIAKSPQDDVQDVVKNAKAINLPADNTVVHAIRQHFQVDDQTGILNPVGMYGARVEVDVHVVHGHVDRLKNSIAVVKGLQLEVDEIVFTGLASALALLSNEQKELGSLVIDMGGGTTEYVVYCDGIIKHTGVLAVGGDHVSNDLAYGLKVPLSRAEQLKLEHGSAVLDPSVKGQTVSAPPELGLAPKTDQSGTSAPHHVAALAGDFHVDRAGTVTSGFAGTAAGRGVHLRRRRAHPANRRPWPKASSNCPPVPAKTNSISGLKSALDQPEFATAIGLVKFGSLQQKRKPNNGLTGGLKRTLADLFKA